MPPSPDCKYRNGGFQRTISRQKRAVPITAPTYSAYHSTNDLSTVFVLRVRKSVFPINSLYSFCIILRLDNFIFWLYYIATKR